MYHWLTGQHVFQVYSFLFVTPTAQELGPLNYIPLHPLIITISSPLSYSANDRDITRTSEERLGIRPQARERQAVPDDLMTMVLLNQDIRRESSQHPFLFFNEMLTHLHLLKGCKKRQTFTFSRILLRKLLPLSQRLYTFFSSSFSSPK